MGRPLLLLVLATACGSGADATTGRTADDAAPPVGPPGGSKADAGPTSDASGSVVIGAGGSRYFGDPHSGNFWIGPVDYAETVFHNACAPSVKYPVAIQQLYGNYIMGLSNQAQLQTLGAGSGQLCDVCAELTANGQILIAHVVTYGDETGPWDIDVSTQVDSALNGASSRRLTWQFTTCPTTAPITYTFDGRQWSNTWFFRVWVRNARVPVAKVEYQLGASAWSTADWQSDGSWQASSADFSGGFSLRVTSIDNQMIEDALPGLNTFDPDFGIASHTNFQ
jgi:hypothetical protein